MRPASNGKGLGHQKVGLDLGATEPAPAVRSVVQRLDGGRDPSDVGLDRLKGGEAEWHRIGAGSVVEVRGCMHAGIVPAVSGRLADGTPVDRSSLSAETLRADGSPTAPARTGRAVHRSTYSG